MNKNIELNKEFWSSFLALPESKIFIHSKAKPSERNYMSLGYEQYLAFYYAIKRGESRAAVYINHYDKSRNEYIFNELLRHKEEIEKFFNEPSNLKWRPLNGNTPCRIGYEMPIGEYKTNNANWRTIQTEMIDAMIRLQNAISPFVKKFI